MTKRYDPLFNRDKTIQAKVKETRTTTLVASNETPPLSPIDGSRMVLSHMRTATGVYPIWVDAKNRITYPTRK